MALQNHRPMVASLSARSCSAIFNPPTTQMGREPKKAGRLPLKRGKIREIASTINFSFESIASSYPRFNFFST